MQIQNYSCTPLHRSLALSKYKSRPQSPLQTDTSTRNGAGYTREPVSSPDGYVQRSIPHAIMHNRLRFLSLCSHEYYHQADNQHRHASYFSFSCANRCLLSPLLKTCGPAAHPVPVLGRICIGVECDHPCAQLIMRLHHTGYPMSVTIQKRSRTITSKIPARYQARPVHCAIYTRNSNKHIFFTDLADTSQT